METTDTYGATVTPMVPAEYNANILVTYKDIVDGVATFPTIKVNELEYKLDRMKSIEDQFSRSSYGLTYIPTR